jgi:hypothetical protein
LSVIAPSPYKFLILIVISWDTRNAKFINLNKLPVKV